MLFTLTKKVQISKNLNKSIFSSLDGVRINFQYKNKNLFSNNYEENGTETHNKISALKEYLKESTFSFWAD